MFTNGWPIGVNELEEFICIIVYMVKRDSFVPLQYFYV